MAQKSSGVNFQFNQTGREDTTTEVLAPKLDAATKQRNLILLIVAIVVGIGMLGTLYVTTKDKWEVAKDKQFAAPEHNIQ